MEGADLRIQTFKIPAYVRQTLAEAAKKCRGSTSTLIRCALAEYVARHAPELIDPDMMLASVDMCVELAECLKKEYGGDYMNGSAGKRYKRVTLRS